jgi:hypothetical protein
MQFANTLFIQLRGILIGLLFRKKFGQKFEIKNGESRG